MIKIVEGNRFSQINAAKATVNSSHTGVLLLTTSLMLQEST